MVTEHLLSFVTVVKVGAPLRVVPKNLVFCLAVYAPVETVL